MSKKEKYLWAGSFGLVVVALFLIGILQEQLVGHVRSSGADVPEEWMNRRIAMEKYFHSHRNPEFSMVIFSEYRDIADKIKSDRWVSVRDSEITTLLIVSERTYFLGSGRQDFPVAFQFSDSELFPGGKTQNELSREIQNTLFECVQEFQKNSPNGTILEFKLALLQKFDNAKVSLAFFPTETLINQLFQEKEKLIKKYGK